MYMVSTDDLDHHTSTPACVSPREAGIGASLPTTLTTVRTSASVDGAYAWAHAALVRRLPGHGCGRPTGGRPSPVPHENCAGGELYPAVSAAPPTISALFAPGFSLSASPSSRRHLGAFHHEPSVDVIGCFNVMYRKAGETAAGRVAPFLKAGSSVAGVHKTVTSFPFTWLPDIVRTDRPHKGCSV